MTRRGFLRNHSARQVGQNRCLLDLSNAWPAVSSLFRCCRPSAVARLVISIVVDAVERMSQRTWTHVAQKRSKRLSPLFTHRDAASTVIRPLRGRWIKATSHGSHPRSVLGCGLVVGIVAVFPASRACGFHHETSATASLAGSQMTSSDTTNSAAAARAFAAPHDEAASVWFSGNHSQPPKGPPDQALGCSGHGTNIIAGFKGGRGRVHGGRGAAIAVM